MTTRVRRPSAHRTPRPATTFKAPRDVNADAAWLLHDLAAIQSSKQKQFAYKRAASAIFRLDEPVTERWSANGPTTPIAGVGPSSSRVISELLATGGSATVERAIEESGRRADVDSVRTLRSHFLSRAMVREVLASERGETAAVPDCLGDFQMHSDWSDGGSTLADMAEACALRGYQFFAMTDHAHGLRIAGGMSMERARAQHQEIDRLNARRSGCLILKGIEANIGPDGQLDLSHEEALEFEFVLAAPHAKLRLAEDQTERMLAAVNAPRTHALAHPRGRVSSTRAGIIADWDRVFAQAATLNVAIELDGDPSRQDIDYVLAARALRAGCVFTLSSDAHSPDELVFIETAIAHARLAGIPRSRIINCWQRDAVLQWIRTRQLPTTAPSARARNTTRPRQR